MQCFRTIGVVGLFTLGGCTGILGIDGDYEVIANDGGANTFGGYAGGDGRTGGSGGMSGAGGMTGTGGVVVADSSVSCGQGMKYCAVPNGDGTTSMQCVLPDPSIGCDPNGPCEQCPSPPGAFPICTADGLCDWRCFEGYTQTSAGCVPNSDGGGMSGECTSDTECQACGGLLGCCSTATTPRRCGCKFFVCTVFP